MDLQAIERACQVVLGGVGSPAERASAQSRVLELGANVANISLIQAILDSSTDNYAIVVAAQSLLRLVTGAWGWEGLVRLGTRSTMGMGMMTRPSAVASAHA